MAPPLIDTFIVPEVPAVLYALFDYGLTEYFMLDKTKNHRYIPGLDGLRALAVLSVIAYHLNFSWAKGGFL